MGNKLKLPPRSIWFDRLSLYRYVAILLLPLFTRSVYRAVTESYPVTWVVPVFWAASVLFYTAIGRDLWQEWKTRREIHKSINEVVNRDESSR
jgi:hypothetical protein